MVKAILFDLDDTLLWDKKSVQTAFDNTCAYAQAQSGAKPAVLERKVREQARALYQSYSTYSFTQMIGINPFEALWGDFAADKGEQFQALQELAGDYRKHAWIQGLEQAGIKDQQLGKELALRFVHERKNNPFVFADTFSILEQLKGDYRLLLLTNGSSQVQRTKLQLTPELVPYFDHILISGEFGKGKPDPAIFEYACSLLVVEKNEAIMVGDNLNSDILGAVRSGMKSVWMNRDHKENQSGINPSYEITSLKELLPIITAV